MNFNSFKLTDLENFSLSCEVIELINKNSSSIGQLERRIIGLVIIPFTQLADTLGHLALACGKTLTGTLTLSLYVVTFGHTSISREFSLPSALIHTMRVVENLFSIVILPFVCLINPLWVQNWKQYSYGTQKVLLQKEVQALKEEIKGLENQLDQKGSLLIAKAETITYLEFNVSRLKHEINGLKKNQKELTNQLAEKERAIQVLEGNIILKEQQHKDELQKACALLQETQQNKLDELSKNQKDQIASLQKEINQFEEAIQLLKNKLESNLKQLQEYAKQEQQLHNNLKDAKSQIKNLQQEIDQSKINNEKEKEDYLLAMSQLENQLRATIEELEKIHQIEELKQREELNTSFIEIATDNQNNSYSQIDVIIPEIDKSSDPGDTKQIANGKVKRVWKKASEEDYVYYTPFNANDKDKKELEHETEKARDIRTRLKDKETYLATDLEIVEHKDRIEINGQPSFTIRARKAEGDLEKFLTKEDLTFQQRIKIVKQVVKGIYNLHLAGYLHGDLKPENFLVGKENNEIVVRLSDFGKAQLMSDLTNSPKMQGNPRFSPPEYKVSEKGEVYGAGLIIIRLLEEVLLDKERLSLIKVENPMMKADKRREIEKFVVEHSDCPQINQWKSKEIISNFYFPLLKEMIYPRSSPNAEKAVHLYIDTLVTELTAKNFTTSSQAENLANLLRAMTSDKPEDRPAMEQVIQRFEKAFEIA